MLTATTPIQTSYIEYATTLQQIQLLHRTDGWITFFRKLGDGTHEQRHYKLTELTHDILNQWVNLDCFLSMNSYYIPKRGLKYLRQLQTCYVDLDCYKIGFTEEQILMRLKADYFGIHIPTPNLIISSGRGLQLIWLLEPISGLAIARWNELQHELYLKLKSLGADPSALDAARVFRLAGSINSKNNQPVTCEVLHKTEYDFYDIAREYFPHMKALTFQSSNKKKKNLKAATQPKKLRHLFTPFSLSKTRLDDLFTLVKMRKGECNGVRELFLFLTRYFALQATQNTEIAFEMTANMNELFTSPLQRKEWKVSTESAVRYHQTGGILLKNETIIDWLNITEKEQQSLKTLISRKEKNERKRKKTEEKRREQGVKERAIYNLARKKKMIAQIKKLHLLKSMYPKASLKELAERMNLSKTTIHRYFVIIKESLHELCLLVEESIKVPVDSEVSLEQLFIYMKILFSKDMNLQRFYQHLSEKLIE